MAIIEKRIGLPLALAAAAVGTLAPAFPGSAQTRPEPTSTMQLDIGRGQLVNLPSSMTDVFVADNSIADVSVRSPTQLYVFAKGAGETNVYATNKAGTVIYASTVRVGQNINSISSMLALAMPEAKITASTMNGLVLLTGTVANPDDAAEATELVQAFVGEKTKVITRLKTATPLQVNLQVRFAEVSRSFVKNIGVNLASADSSGGFKFGVGQGRSFYDQYTPGGTLGVGTDASDGTTSVSGVESGTSLFGAGKLLGLDLLGALDLGETVGQVSTLNTTNLSALSGETGSFLAGGEIPIPISQGLGAVSVQFKQYGVSLAYTPTVLADGRISLRVRPEVSQLSSAGAVTIDSTQIPALTTRRAETTVELGSGQSFMIAGLLSNNHQNQIDKAPGLGDMPILGALFRSNGFQRNETELVIVITPYLVKPVDGSHIALPTDGYRAPTDLERVLLGKMQGGQTGSQRPQPRMAPDGTVQPSLGASSSPLPSGPNLPDTDEGAAVATAPTTSGSRRGGDGKNDGAAPGFSIP
ncbi:type II and III secretion system protein family protein [Stakelama sp. CBK3Z-3]|uniref:Type II and III secretion system protein family protein n=1 Tax=Stakelama flava TaxID=2860338 RepID=A0ABS6XMS1_9SPHN|nr:type II and III secretion system protein family protein [Stakelama flava]MBW4331497.1 type II and III secretion system protein family protein [Stakelama flava]